MKKYRKKPIVVEAVQFLPILRMVYPGVEHDEEGYYIETISGVARFKEGDYVLTEMDGKNYYPVPKEIFEASYEECVDD